MQTQCAIIIAAAAAALALMPVTGAPTVGVEATEWTVTVQIVSGVPDPPVPRALGPFGNKYTASLSACTDGEFWQAGPATCKAQT